MASIFRDPMKVTFVDEDQREFAQLTDLTPLPRVGENVRVGRVPYVVLRIGYDIGDKQVERVWIVCRKA